MGRTSGAAATLVHETLWIPGSADWAAYTEAPVTNATNTYAKTIVQKPSTTHAIAEALGVGRIETTAGAEGNDRRFLYAAGAPAIDDSEIVSLWYGHTDAASGQLGHVHRLQNIGDGVDQVAIVVWEDVLFALEGYINVGLWRGIDANFALVDNVGNWVDGVTAFPAWVRSRVVGDEVWVKAWPPTIVEPAWSHPDHVLTHTLTDAARPQGPGHHGILLAHTAAGEYQEYGEIRIARPTGAAHT